MNQQDRQEIKRYFSRSTKKAAQWPMAFIILGLFVAVASDNLTSRWIGVAVIVLSGVVAIGRATASPSDAQIDLWLQEDFESLQQKALAEADLDTSYLVRSNVVLAGPQFRSLDGAGFGLRRGRDGRFRFTTLDVLVFNFTEHAFIAYKCDYDFTTGNSFNTSLTEYFYNDVVSVSTQSASLTYDVAELNKWLLSRSPDILKLSANGKVRIDNVQLFVITIASGASIQIVLFNPLLARGSDDGELLLRAGEAAVQTIRKMLREKKAGSLPLR